jgi:hypothetical protein
LQKCLAYFAGVDRSLTGYEGLIAAQDCLPTDEVRDAFAADFSVLWRVWEALSPDPVLTQYEKDYRWLGQVYESLKPSTGTGRSRARRKENSCCSSTAGNPNPAPRVHRGQPANWHLQAKL